ncbi:hypothetical protein BD310DRAFT_377227 [Dichomitus squalens]|uniref:Uncharacterized protein n=1 Tax=Dichomitus squalens TaxID=114155 RepID=A0A4Q9PE41_9APHY|nr:hypothetical protein BD310DRAFT_377227 [Dichomitus squalens]
MVYATSSTPIIRQRDFKRGFLQLLFSDLEKEIDRALSSLQFRYNGSLHAEAIGMALACSVHKARPVEAELPQQLSYLKPIFEFDTIASRQLWYVLKIDRSIQSPSVFARSAASAAILSRLSSPAFMMNASPRDLSHFYHCICEVGACTISAPYGLQSSAFGFGCSHVSWITHYLDELHCLVTCPPSLR